MTVRYSSASRQLPPRWRDGYTHRPEHAAARPLQLRTQPEALAILLDLHVLQARRGQRLAASVGVAEDVWGVAGGEEPRATGEWHAAGLGYAPLLYLKSLSRREDLSGGAH